MTPLDELPQPPPPHTPCSDRGVDPLHKEFQCQSCHRVKKNKKTKKRKKNVLSFYPNPQILIQSYSVTLVSVAIYYISIYIYTFCVQCFSFDPFSYVFYRLIVYFVSLSLYDFVVGLPFCSFLFMFKRF